MHIKLEILSAERGVCSIATLLLFENFVSVGPPTYTSSSFLAVDSAPTALGLFQLLARRSGTH